MLAFLGDRAPWVRPADTGRSTNCLINNTGIYVHQAERGFHNYALPYSWDVRLGHKTKAAAVAELQDEIDVTQVRQILTEISYQPKALIGTESRRQVSKRLAAYYVPHNDGVAAGDLREYLAARLPDYMIPTYFTALESMPLTANGKIARDALPDPRLRSRSAGRGYVGPRTEMEAKLVSIWETVIGVAPIGVHDGFIELGGDSIMNVQIVAAARKRGIVFTSQQLFECSSIAALAETATEAKPPQLSRPRRSTIGEEELAELVERFSHHE